jgi:hypothetical protein
LDKRYVHQWQQAGADCDDKTRHWTEIRLMADELLVMLGCAKGSSLIGLHIDRDGFSLTITADEHQEAPPCPLADAPPSSSGQS